MTATPLKIEMLLHFYYRGNVPKAYADNNRPVVVEARAWLVANELINENGEMTSRGGAYVAMILNTPLPVPTSGWRDPRTGEIIEESL